MDVLENPFFLGGGKEEPLVPTGPGRYEVSVKVPGTLLDGQRRIPLQLPLSGEWTPRDGKEVLRALAEASGGRLLDLEALVGPGAGNLRTSSPLSLRPYLLLMALALFLLERFLERRLDVPRPWTLPIFRRGA